MAQISKGDTFNNGEQVTGARLNQLVDSATLLVTAITDQPSITANTLQATDTTLVNDAGVLKEATISDLLNSGLPVTASSVTTEAIPAPANKDIRMTPSDGVVVLGSNYVSANGINVTVTTLAAHGLLVENSVSISNAGAGYNGEFKITAVTSLTFQFSLYTAATPTASPVSCSFVRKATASIIGNEVVSGNFFVGVKTNTLDLRVDGQADVNFAEIKTANITSDVQYSGVPVFGLASIAETTIAFDQASATSAALILSTCNIWRNIASLTNQTKTNKEIWEIEGDFVNVFYPLRGPVKFSIFRVGTGTNLALEVKHIDETALYVRYLTHQVKIRCIIPANVTFTNETIHLRHRYNVTVADASAFSNIGYGGALSDSDITRVFRVTKHFKP